ncbi:TIGR01906 family membrane protein [Latilactobacillus curvatus]|uniref:TIGR01906 family membrane protein n=1 Tax=Latilactobacillus curvatus TaxID=28038 RepID=UPI0038891FA7
MGRLKRVRSTTSWAALYLALVSSAILITLLLSWALYPLVSHYLDLASQRELTQPRLMMNFNRLMGYLLVPWQPRLQLPDFPMSLDGRQHFVEVKRLFGLAVVIWLVTIGAAIQHWQSRRKTNRVWQYVRPMQVALVVPPILGFIASMNFDRFFITFHELLFRNLNWQFDPITDPIILVLPEVYFGLCFALFFILLEGSFAWLLWRGKRAL